MRDEVLAATNREQFPYVYGSLSGDGIYLRDSQSSPEPASAAPAGDYPRRAITLVVPFAAGGPSDAIARLVGERLTQALGQPVVVQNQLGEVGKLGTSSVARAAPDGYTLLLGDSVTHGINPSVFPSTGYDPHNDFEPVGLFGTTQLALIAHPSLNAQTVGELTALLRREPRRASFSIPGRGSLNHLVAQQFANAAGVKVIPVVSATEAQAFMSVANGQSMLHFIDPRHVVGPARAGQVRALAVTGAKRSSLLPGVPTLAESGLGGFEAGRNYGLLAPAGTPRPVIERLNLALRNAFASGELRAKLAAQGLDPAVTTADQHARTIDKEIAKWFAVMRSAGIQPR